MDPDASCYGVYQRTPEGQWLRPATVFGVGLVGADAAAGLPVLEAVRS